MQLSGVLISSKALFSRYRENLKIVKSFEGLAHFHCRVVELSSLYLFFDNPWHRVKVYARPAFVQLHQAILKNFYNIQRYRSAVKLRSQYYYLNFKNRTDERDYLSRNSSSEGNSELLEEETKSTVNQ